MSYLCHIWLKTIWLVKIFKRHFQLPHSHTIILLHGSPAYVLFYVYFDWSWSDLEQLQLSNLVCDNYSILAYFFKPCLKTKYRFFFAHFVRGLAPFFDTRKVEAFLCIFYLNFWEFVCPRVSGFIIWNLGSFSEFIANIFWTETMQTLVCHFSFIKGEQRLIREPCTSSPVLIHGIVY